MARYVDYKGVARKRIKVPRAELEYPDTQDGWRLYLIGKWGFSPEQIDRIAQIRSKPQFDVFCKNLSGR